eukprot:GFKZ01012222.1.p1 GENE.GFKZ01012222.1~~GFKZ01012222.1.p1  ORF type:complete len:125 (+),score=15.37 GFKZ01012222.1:48-377(+)
MSNPPVTPPSELNILQAHLASLQKRYDLAQRRLAAHIMQCGNAQEPQNLYVGTPNAIVAMKERLHACANDETEVQKLAQELREVKERLTEKALEIYANRCDEAGFGGRQ